MKRIFLIAGICLALTGCNTNNDKADQSNQSLVKVKNSYINDVDRKSGQDISKRLVEIATRVPEVNDATAVVLGKYAIVGIDVNAKIDRTEVGTIKYTVAESLKHDPYGANAVVVADADTMQRLKEINTDIKNGRPLRGIMDELAAISGRLMPQVPNDIIDPDPKSPMEKEPDNKLPADEKKELKKEQDKQSNFHK
jgi:YhcN/YlaJ family sporulation lipoprotein